MRAPQRGQSQPKAVNGYVYEHVHVNDHVDVDVLVHVDVFFTSNYGVTRTPENVKLLLPP